MDHHKMDCSASGGSGVGSSSSSSNVTSGNMSRQTKRIAPTSSSSIVVSPTSNVSGGSSGDSSSTSSSGSSSSGTSGCLAQMSATSSSTLGSAASDLTSLFECPVCFDYVLPPIMQCQNGHLVCTSCRTKVTCCPTCRVPIANNIRNLPMEKLAVTMMFPCKYSSSGCSTSLLYTDKIEHEESCEFKPYQCPCPGLYSFFHDAI